MSASYFHLNVSLPFRHSHSPIHIYIVNIKVCFYFSIPFCHSFVFLSTFLLLFWLPFHISKLYFCFYFLFHDFCSADTELLRTLTVSEKGLHLLKIENQEKEKRINEAYFFSFFFSPPSFVVSLTNCLIASRCI